MVGINFDDGTGVSYQEFPKDQAAREAILIVNHKLEEIKESTVSRQNVINLENKVKQSGLDSENFKEQVNVNVKKIKDIVDGLDGGNLEKIKELEASVNNKAPRDLVDSLLGQIEGSVKKINGVTPDEEGNVEINVNTEGLATKDELEGLVDGLESQITAKADQTEINAAKGSFATLKEKLDSIGTGGGGAGSLNMDVYDGRKVQKNYLTSLKGLVVLATTETTFTLKWHKTNDATKYNIFQGTTKKGESTTDTYVVTGLTKNTPYTLHVQADNGTKQSSKIPIEVKTLGSMVLSTPFVWGSGAVQLPEIECYGIEIVTHITPKTDTWGNHLLTAGELKNSRYPYQIATEYNGVDFFGIGFDYFKVDGVSYDIGQSKPIPTGSRKTYLAGKEVPFKTAFMLLREMGAATPTSKLYTVRMLGKNDLGQFSAIAEYDFTRTPTTAGKVPDSLGNYGDATVLNGTFVSNTL